MLPLQTWRRRRGWTQADLARRARVSQQRISRIERGDIREPGLFEANRICRALRVKARCVTEFIEQ